MKKIILSLALTGAISFVSAQTTSGQGAGNTTQASSSGTSKKTNKKNSSVAADTINNRKVYKSKSTGQAATNTGQQATGTNGSHSNLPKNAVKGKND